MSTKVGTYEIRTASGGIINFHGPDPGQITLEDIARGLANVCRYSGQVRQFYSVAEHCIMVSRHAPLHLKPYALIHDAAEAYIGDVPRPVKLLCPEYQAVEHRVEQAILKRFNIGQPSSGDLYIIKTLDNASLLLEASALKVGDSSQWLDVPGEPLDDVVQCLSPEKAERAWLQAADLLGVG
jgi:hypothetical protein